MKKTIERDKCKCVYCDHIFNELKIINYDIHESFITCPKCNKEMNIYISCEILCREIKS